ncbi:Protein IWS1 -like protein [Trichinella pseudospiralis]|uniref:Protein IWS1-like protein n=2 Tax=Trichinella pseudospiralis TaxID=6337 RepID=A0A0V1IV83_TRIPS|nr:Protein IWS1 -like protein [Trichinella pseudospiralis]KRZ26551.1 Protein IWS1 -like protein [Trichinella pseudospiralis]KRZ42313.1 Protein IWS1 -like protein [Trichinella pseudospiralis]
MNRILNCLEDDDDDDDCDGDSLAVGNSENILEVRDDSFYLNDERGLYPPRENILKDAFCAENAVDSLVRELIVEQSANEELYANVTPNTEGTNINYEPSSSIDAIQPVVACSSRTMLVESEAGSDGIFQPCDDIRKLKGAQSRTLSESESSQSDVNDVIENIFGNSEDEEEVLPPSGRFATSSTATADAVEEKVEQTFSTSDSEDEEHPLNEKVDVEEFSMPPGFVSDFDLMMQKRKRQNRRRRRRYENADFISDADDKIHDLIERMNHAAQADRESNVAQKPALQKRKLLPYVLSQLKKADLQTAFIESGAVTAIAEWLQLLPDRSLPSYEIRTELLKILQQFPVLDASVLRSSNIGKVVMILHKHPKETKENRVLAGRLISDWARPIFNLQTDYRSLSKEERQRRDYKTNTAVAKKMKTIDDDINPGPSNVEEESKPLRPGDKGFIPRARVPQLSTKDYVIRPKSNVDASVENKHVRRTSEFEFKLRMLKERMKRKKALRAVTVSIEGRKMD